MAPDPNALRQSRIAVIQLVVEQRWLGMTPGQQEILSDAVNDCRIEEFCELLEAAKDAASRSN